MLGFSAGEVEVVEGVDCLNGSNARNGSSVTDRTRNGQAERERQKGKRRRRTSQDIPSGLPRTRKQCPNDPHRE
jgi:hypothetical protein